MLPVTVTGSAFDRKIVSVLPVPFCQVRAREPDTKYLFIRMYLHGREDLINRKLSSLQQLILVLVLDADIE